MSQKSQSDGGQKHFAVGRGLLAAAETLNFSMNEQRSGRQMGGAASGVGVGGGGGGSGMDNQDGGSQMSRRGGGGHIGNTMKLFASLGLSPSDLDALAEIPEEDISVETLPRILMQLKSRKGDAGERRGASSVSSDAGYRGGRDSWDNAHMGRMGGPSLGTGSARGQTSADFGYSSLQDGAPSQGYGLNYGGGGGGSSRERPYSELSHHDSYGGGLSIGPPASDPGFRQRRIGSPSNGKVQDFLGVTPPMFPHVCSLCDFDVHSTMEWNQHTNGVRHDANRRLLLNMYQDWEPGMSSGRSGSLLDTPNMSAGLLGPAPMSSSHTGGGTSSSWGGGGGGPGLSGKNQSGQNKLRSRVVVVKYDRKPLSNKTLFSFTEPFGRLTEHLVLKNKAFLEMSSHEEAVDMVNYYEQQQASLYGKPLSFYLSRRLMVIEKDERATERHVDRPAREVKGQGSQVVFFSNLPREEERKKELLTIAGRFGIVEKHLFLTDQAFVQLGTPEDAEMLVKYYSVNSLTIKGRPIRLNICTKYKTLTVNRRQGGDGRSQKSSGANASSGFGTRTSFNPARTSSSKSSSRTREEQEKEEELKPEEQPPAEEEEEEVSGVMEGEEVEEQVTDGDAEGEEPEGAAEEPEEVKQEEVSVDVTEDAPGDVGVAEGEVQQEAESEGQTEQAEADVTAEEHENKEEPAAEPGEPSETVEGDPPADVFDGDFLENMEDFVTLDELEEDEDEADGESDSTDSTRRGGMRVVNIVGFRRGYNFINELQGLAKPFGKVVKHLVLDLRPEAYLQFATEEEAKAMASFYNSNITASVCGRPVRVSHSISYPTIQCGSSKVVYVGQIPNTKYSDDAVLKLAEPFGRVKKYFLNRLKRECFIEMERAEEAEKMAEGYKADPPRFSGKRLTVYVSRKYRQLKHGHRCPDRPKRENSSMSPSSSQQPEEPPAKKCKEEEKEPEEEEQVEVEVEVTGEAEEVQSCDDEKKEEKSSEDIPEVSDRNQTSSQEEAEQAEAEMDTSANQNGRTEAPPPAENKPSVASLPLPPHDPDTPIGVEHVKMGFYCRVCFLFYSNEETAKKTHCSSQTHHDKLQKHLEKEQTKAEKKKGKKTSS
ncbi:matrin 3-like 1.2 isoform X2 [Cyclopterus lumpus]|uniref:matrin 3-like 1.2 isoform X2 n=1 Tax=Cyclopterus lumpus TaxID=8103 RepID=UPI0014875B12|nr:matrin 3-like 1.2 isoform X2 [Cyclopterus lumpus]